MGRPRTNGDERKKEKIRRVLAKHPRYLCEIARMCDMAPSTVFNYVNTEDGFMKDEVLMDESFGTVKNKVVTRYKLRKGE